VPNIDNSNGCSTEGGGSDEKCDKKAEGDRTPAEKIPAKSAAVKSQVPSKLPSSAAAPWLSFYHNRSTTANKTQSATLQSGIIVQQLKASLEACTFERRNSFDRVKNSMAFFIGQTIEVAR